MRLQGGCLSWDCIRALVDPQAENKGHLQPNVKTLYLLQLAQECATEMKTYDGRRERHRQKPDANPDLTLRRVGLNTYISWFKPVASVFTRLQITSAVCTPWRSSLVSSQAYFVKKELQCLSWKRLLQELRNVAAQWRCGDEEGVNEGVCVRRRRAHFSDPCSWGIGRPWGVRRAVCMFQNPSRF